MHKTIVKFMAILLLSSSFVLASCSGESKESSATIDSSASATSTSVIISSDGNTSSMSTKIAAPVIAINANSVSWKAVDHARLYQVSVAGDVYETSDTAFTIEKNAPGSWEIKVKALSKDAGFADSDWSNSVTYLLDAKTLSAPSLTLNGTTVEWAAIPNADAYEVFINDAMAVKQTTTTYTITETNLGTYLIGVKAISSSALFTESQFSNLITYKIEASDLAIPVIANRYNTISWSAIEHADSYNVYVNDAFVQNVLTTSVDLDVSKKGDYKVEIEAVSASALYKTSGKSNAILLSLGGEVEESNSIYDEAFTHSIRVDGGQFAIVNIDDATTAKVWLRYFVKSSDKSIYNIKLLKGDKEITVVDSTQITDQAIAGKGLNGPLSSSTQSGFELEARRLDGNSDIALGGKYKFVITNESENTTITLIDFHVSAYASDAVSETDACYNLSTNGSFLQNTAQMNDIFFYNCWIPHSTIAIDFNAWAVIDYNGTFKGISKTNSNQTVPSDLRYQSLSKAIQLPELSLDHYSFQMAAGNVGANESALIWKVSAVCEETGKTYVISDWTVNAFGTDSSFAWAFSDNDSAELSGKKIDLTVQWKRQENYNDAWKARAYVSNFAIDQTSDPLPVPDNVWEIQNGVGSYDKDAKTEIKSDIVNGLLNLKAGATATLSSTIDPSMTSNVWISFFAKAETSTTAGVTPSIDFKLSTKIDDTSYLIYNWNRLGGTSSKIDNSSVVANGAVNETIANDRYEIFMISLDEYAFGYAGKNVTFTLETRDSGDGTTQSFYMAGFALTQYTTKMGVSSAYSGLSEWTSNFSRYTEFGTYPIPGGWLRSLACTDTTKGFQYQGDVTDATMPIYESGKTQRFSFTFSNYGNYTSILYKLSAVDEEGDVFVLNDWNYLVGPGTDKLCSEAIPETTAEALSGKKVALLLQFNDTKMIDSPYENRMYITNFSFANE